ncbi:MAG: NUDIX domain-containing protein [Pseudomonadota bacterium]
MRGHLIWRLRVLIRPPVTLGVRCLVRDSTGAVVLVRHTYVRGWHFPGGAVDPGESAADAAHRELMEETGISPTEAPHLVSLYFNRSLAARDHVALYRWDLDHAIDPSSLRAQPREIAEVGLFAPGQLPDGVSSSVRRRLEEGAQDGEPSTHW